ncbi:MAG: Gfo/Idh/MocA family oxidoreductase [Proteobacteria bacterium]|nr:Gfo/Idh/MocA family oxidoreductase [Pseudomonadota bacterium]
MTGHGTDQVVLAVVGAGGWGRNHVRAFASLPQAQLRYVCDHSAAALQRVAREFPAIRPLDRFEQALADPDLGAVVIATDVDSHYELAKIALSACKDVFVEKPLTMSERTSAELCDLAEARGRILMVGHLLLYHPAVEALHALVEGGELGDVRYTYAQRLNLGVVRQRENAWWSLAPHDISVASYLFGDEPLSVSATGGVFLQTRERIEDVVFATLRYPRDRLAHIHVSWLDPHKTRRLTVVGSRKMAVFDDASADQKLSLYDKGAEASKDALSYTEGVRIRTGDIRIPALAMAEPLRRECEAFIQAVRSRKPPKSDGRSGLSVVRVLEAATRSLSQAGTRVSLATSAAACGRPNTTSRGGA